MSNNELLTKLMNSFLMNDLKISASDMSPNTKLFYFGVFHPDSMISCRRFLADNYPDVPIHFGHSKFSLIGSDDRILNLIFEKDPLDGIRGRTAARIAYDELRKTRYDVSREESVMSSCENALRSVSLYLDIPVKYLMLRG